MSSRPMTPRQRRSQRGAVEDRWRKRIRDEDGNSLEVPSAVAGQVTRWPARYVDNAGREHTRAFAVRQAEVHIKIIKAHFGSGRCRPSNLRMCGAGLPGLKDEGRAASYVYALCARLSQLFTDAVHDRLVVSPMIQWPDEPLKSDASPTPIPIPSEMAQELHVAVEVGNGRTVVTDEWGNPAEPWTIERAIRAAQLRVDGLPEIFRFPDLRHYFASLLISSGLDVKVVQARLRHASAKTTLDTSGHLWPDRDDTSRAAVAAVHKERSDD